MSPPQRSWHVSAAKSMSSRLSLGTSVILIAGNWHLRPMYMVAVLYDSLTIRLGRADTGDRF